MSTRSGNEKAVVRLGTRAATSSTAQQRESDVSGAEASASQASGVRRRRCGEACAWNFTENRARRPSSGAAPASPRLTNHG